MRKLFFCLLVFSLSISVTAQQKEKINMEMIQKIRKEGLENSKVMDIAFHLTDVSGPRLTNSPGFTRAATWAIEEMKKWGLENAKPEPWGNFGKGWELQRSYLAMTSPYYKPIIAYPKAWTAGTNGLKTVEVVLLTAKDSTELSSYSGKLNGKIILTPLRDTLRQSFNADAQRFQDTALQRMASYDPKNAPQRQGQGGSFRGRGQQGFSINTIKEFAKNQGAVGILSAFSRGKDGTLFVQGGGVYQLTSPENFTDLVIAFEDYMTITRLLQAGLPVKLEADVKTQFYTKDATAYNVIAEIKGTDKKLKDEIVMLGGHLDSWQGATGATDNAAGCAVMLETVRILKALGVQPRRTIRIALWSGEEQGLLGSRNYVRNHFTDTVAKKTNAAGDKVSVYFNLDNGTGKIRGVYLQGNENVKPVFTKWLEPFKDLDASTLTLSNTGGTDHLSFDGIGIPGFQFIQDPIEYNTRTHHTNMDSYDHLIADDLKQAATIIAAFVYNAAMRDEKIPRKPVAETRPAAGN